MELPELQKLNRINVIGTSGSGKSTFSERLSRCLDLPFYKMDELYWKPKWQGSTDKEMFQKVEKVTSKSTWILDGNYSRTQPIKWKNVQTIIWIDLPFLQTLKQITARSVQRALTGEELWPGTGNRESVYRTFLTRQSVIWWMISSFKKNRKRYGELMDHPPSKSIHCIRLKSHQQIELFFNKLAKLQAPAT